MLALAPRLVQEALPGHRALAVRQGLCRWRGERVFLQEHTRVVFEPHAVEFDECLVEVHTNRRQANVMTDLLYGRLVIIMHINSFSKQLTTAACLYGGVYKNV